MPHNVHQLCEAIAPVNTSLLPTARAHLDDLTKPRGSLGRLEDIAAQIYCIEQGRTPLSVSPAAMYTVAGDHGVTAEGVSPYPQEVTRQMVHNFLNNGGGINVLCRANGLSLHLVDAGCVGGPFAPHPMLLDKRLGDGTKNLLREDAMTVEQCATAVMHGANIAADAAREGVRCIAAGEMGIGNTTPATALFCAYLGLSPQHITGPGCGADAAMVAHKKAVIEQALARCADRVRTKDALGCLAALGGFEIALMAGIMLGGARHGMVVLVDGFISTAAFAAARALCPAVARYCILTHSSAEPGYAAIIEALDMPAPLLQLGFRLGEGTGAATAYALVRSAAAIYNEMATMSQAGVSDKA